MNTKEAAIQYLIYRHHNFLRVIPNVHTDDWGGSEVDALYLTNSNRAYFYEIKTTYQDFKADLKKKRHKLLSGKNDTIKIKPKFFYYVCYGFGITGADVPEYAGLYLINGNGLKLIKKAPVLWKDALTQGNIDFIYSKVMHRYLNYRHDIGRKAWQAGL